MSRHLFTVEDRFRIEGRGLVLIPGILPEGEECFQTGDPLLLERPDGSQLKVTIAGLELLHPNPRNDVVVLLTGLEKTDVPIGTEVWSKSDA